MFKTDACIYDACLTVLLNRGLDTRIEAPQLVALRQLGDQVEQVFVDATQEFSQAFTSPKVELVARFGHLITRVVGLCQVAQALHGPGFGGDGRADMVEAWEAMCVAGLTRTYANERRSDFEMVRNHCALATNCHQEQLTHCFTEFAKLLHSEQSFTPKDLSLFLNGVLQNFTSPDANGERFLAPRSLLVRATFVITQLMRGAL
jgi:regulatory factor X